jgi:hypothetical protein
MRRKMPSETVTKIPIDYFEQNRALREKCIRWAEDNISALKASDVVVPSCGNDRAQDNWFPLFAIADLAGGNWPEKVLAAYNLIEALDPEKDDSIAIMLLTDIKRIFDKSGRDRMHSDDIVNQLIVMDDRPWPEWKHGKPMTKASLSRLLKPHKIKPKTVRLGDNILKGYELKSFQDAFNRYLSVDTPSQNVTSLQTRTGAGFSDFQGVTDSPSVTFKKPPKPSNGAGCNDVTDEIGGNGESGKYPLGLLDALAVSASGLNITPRQVFDDLDPDDYQTFIDHPENARSIAERLAYRK